MQSLTLVLNGMNESLPFYAYNRMYILTNALDVCGGYRLKNTVPSNRRQVTRLTTLSDQVDEILFDILHSDYQNVATITLDNNTTDRLDAEAIKKADESNFNLLKGYYESCIHDEEVQNIGSASVRRLYDRIFNFSIGLPIPTDRGWNGTTSNEISIIGEAIRRMGSLDIPAFIQYGPYQSLLKPVSFCNQNYSY